MSPGLGILASIMTVWVQHLCSDHDLHGWCSQFSHYWSSLFIYIL